MTSHQLRVSDSRGDPTGLIHRTFPPLYEAQGRSPDMAIFVREGCHGQRIFYFAPGAFGFARAVHAAPCPPRRAGT